MSKKSLIFSLLFSLLSIAGCIIYIAVLSPFLRKYGIKYAFFTLIFGFILGGLVPLIFVIVKKMDISVHIKKKMLLSILYVVVSIITWVFLLNKALSFLIFVTPSIMVILEIRYSLFYCKDSKEKMLVFLSSPIIPYCGMLIDISHAFSTTIKF